MLVLPERKITSSFTNLRGIESISATLLAVNLQSNSLIYFVATRLREKILSISKLDKFLISLIYLMLDKI